MRAKRVKKAAAPLTHRAQATAQQGSAHKRGAAPLAKSGRSRCQTAKVSRRRSRARVRAARMHGNSCHSTHAQSCSRQRAFDSGLDSACGIVAGLWGPSCLLAEGFWPAAGYPGCPNPGWVSSIDEGNPASARTHSRSPVRSDDQAAAALSAKLYGPIRRIGFLIRRRTLSASGRCV